MKKTRYSKLRFSIVISVMVLLIAVGVILAVRMFDNYSALILQNTDNQLISLARSVDRSAESNLERYAENLVHTLEHEERKEVERLWLEEGNTEELLAFLETSLLGQDESITTILILQEDTVKLSTNGENKYQFVLQAGRDGEVVIRPCVGEDETVFLAFIKETESGLQYAALVDVTYLYEEVTGNLSSELQNEIIMLDAGKQTLVHREGSGVTADLVADFSESDSKYSMLSFLLEQQDAGEEGMDFCDAVSGATGKDYQARMAVVPATEDTNGYFAIGVSTDYDETTRPIRLGTVQLIVYGSMVLLGVVSLVILLFHTFRGGQRALKEVEILQEKNAAMEELNRQTQEFAHHQRLELMGTLTSGIAHEFNNLLAPIMGYSILVLEKLPPEETEIYDEVLEIYNTSIKAKTVVSRLQDLSRKNANTDFRKLELDEVVRKSVEIATPAKPKPVEIQMELKCANQFIKGNETQISQLLLNLIINAFHATEEKGGIVTVSTEVKDKKLLLKIADDGYGISEENMNRIFEPFFTTKKGGQGTGLGLAIAQQVVEDHGGIIKVESVKGEGTTFLVEFPIIFEKS